jgi:4-hydroxythreonine-4-phosphate dehydrogenase
MALKRHIAISMGDPAGIGPEIICKAFAAGACAAPDCYTVVGDSAVLEKAAGYCKLELLFNPVMSIDQARPGALNVLEQKRISPADFTLGQVSDRCGQASYEYVRAAIALALEKKIDAIVTAPINKEALKKAGIPFPGHTEILAHETGAPAPSMIFYQEHVAVAHVTTHCSLRTALGCISQDRISGHITTLHGLLRQLGVAHPRIAVAGLNPHAGENGLFGDEEEKHITPAIAKAARSGLTVSGPYPPDTVFMRAFKGEFDGVVSMLHDHGFVALKSRDFLRGVNITAGLPIIRTSVGHGTAFDIAGTGEASEKGLIEALKIASLLSDNL